MAAELNMAVVVSSTNERRTGSSLRTMLDGALDNHRVLVLLYLTSAGK